MSAALERSTRQDLRPLLNARSIAILGISQTGRFGGILYENLRRFGYDGEIHGVNPRYDTLFDRPCHASLRELPERPDLALLAVPNGRLVSALEEVAECGIPAAALFASAYSEPADGEPSLQDQLAEIATANDIVVCGPNCMGFVAPGHGLAVSGYEMNPDTPAGNVAMITHSGSVWEAFLQNRRAVAFNYIVSSGNEMVTTVADYMQFVLNDDTTRVIGLFLETVRDPQTFVAALAEASERDIPIVALKTGRSERGARLAQAHSGALAGEDGAYEAIFEAYGVARVRSVDEMMDTLELFASGMRPSTSHVSAVLDSGGQRAMMVDLAEAEGVSFARITKETEAHLRDVLEPGLEPVNPLDAWGTGNGADTIFAECLRALDADPATGLNLLAVDLCPMDDADAFYASIVEEVKGDLRNPIAVLGHLSAAASEVQTSGMRALGVPMLLGTETGLRAVRHVLDYCAHQRGQGGEPIGSPLEVPVTADATAIRARVEAARTPLDEHASKRILEAYGLTTTEEVQVDTLERALLAAEAIGYPVALKTCGDAHKTEHGGVVLGLASDEALADAYANLEARLGPQALVQQMIGPGTELILGVVRDPQFGPMLSLGMGGIFVEILKDVHMLRLPTTEKAVRAALGRLRGWALLAGARGRPPADLDAVVNAALRLAQLAQDLGGAFAEIDINPLMALPTGAVVVDALIVPAGAAATLTRAPAASG